MMKILRIFIHFFFIFSLSVASFRYDIIMLLSRDILFFVDENYYAVQPSFLEEGRIEEFVRELCRYHDEMTIEKYAGKVYLINVDNGKIIAVYTKSTDEYREYPSWE